MNNICTMYIYIIYIYLLIMAILGVVLRKLNAIHIVQIYIYICSAVFFHIHFLPQKTIKDEPRDD